MPKPDTADLSTASSIIYVRVRPELKRRLRALADRDFGGSMAAALAHLLEAHVSGKTTTATGNHPPGYLDEE